MSLSAFVRNNPQADRAQIKSAMVGNICRCTGYERIIDAVVDHLAASHAVPALKEVSHG